MVWPNSKGWAVCHVPLGAAAMTPRLEIGDVARQTGRCLENPAQARTDLGNVDCRSRGKLDSHRTRGSRPQRQVEVEVGRVQPFGFDFSLRVASP